MMRPLLTTVWFGLLLLGARAFAGADTATSLPPPARIAPIQNPNTKKLVSDSVPIASQADAFTECSEVINAYGTFFRFQNGQVFDNSVKQKEMKEMILLCLGTGGGAKCDKDKFMQYVSLAARAKDIRRIILECNTQNLNLQSMRPKDKDKIPFNILGKEGGDANWLKSTNGDSSKFSDVTPVKPEDHKSFTFNKDIVNALGAEKMLTKIDLGQEMAAYKGFILEAMASVPSVPSLAPPPVGAPPAGSRYNLLAQQVDLHSQGINGKFDIVSQSPSDKSGRLPASASDLPLDKALNASSVEHSKPVADIVNQYFTEKKDKPDFDGIYTDQHAADNLADLGKSNEAIKNQEKEEIERRTRAGQNTKGVKFILTANEESFRTFVNNIWPTSVVNTPAPQAPSGPTPTD